MESLQLTGWRMGCDGLAGSAGFGSRAMWQQSTLVTRPGKGLSRCLVDLSGRAGLKMSGVFPLAVRLSCAVQPTRGLGTRPGCRRVGAGCSSVLLVVAQGAEAL